MNTKERLTGIQFTPINTLYQLIAEVEENAELVEIAGSSLTIADYFNYLFSGVGRAEVSLASTTQLYNPITAQWSTELMGQFGIPERLFPPVVPSGTRLGPLTPELREETGLTDIEVIATCSHDTGAAVAAVPAEGDDWAYLSSGTWSLIGVELPSPLINNDVREHNFTNEAGFGGTTRFLKNIIGFLKPDDMPAKIAAYCRETEQPEPATPGQVARCILESLALLYRQALDDIEHLTGRKIARLHIVGGGSQSTLLNQFAASATGRTVLADPCALALLI